jgi:hypothetical protein
MDNSKRRVLTLRCLAYTSRNGDQQGFFAICIDLNLFTWRPTLAQAKKSLNDAISGYLETACDLAKAEQISLEKLPKFILRPAPFWPYKAKYYTYSFLGSLKRDTDTGTTFSEPVNVSALCATA